MRLPRRVWVTRGYESRLDPYRVTRISIPRSFRDWLNSWRYRDE